jgi:hypothetical protein
VAVLPAGFALVLGHPSGCSAAVAPSANSGTVFDPSTFQPVCGASDSVYRGLQGIVQLMVGEASYREYSPLIAGSLLRVRLELCVVESFFNEAIAPFIRERGLSWVLPLHETVETFIAGVVFAVATNFILIGSTKIITVLVTYTDVFVGLPIRLVSGVAWCARTELCELASVRFIATLRFHSPRMSTTLRYHSTRAPRQSISPTPPVSTAHTRPLTI